MPGRHAATGRIDCFVGIHAEVHFVGVLVVVQHDFFQAVVEIILRIVEFARVFATRAGGAAASTARFAGPTMFSGFARAIGSLFGLFAGMILTAWLAFGTASATAPTAPATAATRFAVFVRWPLSTILRIG